MLYAGRSIGLWSESAVSGSSSTQTGLAGLATPEPQSEQTTTTRSQPQRTVLACRVLGAAERVLYQPGQSDSGRSQPFFPIYNELQQKKRELNREIRRIMREEGGPMVSEDGSLKAIDAKADVNIKIAELEKEYLQKFKQVLPASKILKIQNAEEQFNSQILKEIQQTRGQRHTRCQIVPPTH